MTNIDALLGHIDRGLDPARERLFAWLRIPSISAEPAHSGDCRRAAGWVCDELAGLGFNASVREAAGHPVVLAHHPGPGGDAPHLLYYGHYDVQPADPLALWTSPPFEPALVDGPHGQRVVARGAVDDKGQTMLWLEAFRAYHTATGELPARVTVLVEGEEEVGSPSLSDFLVANRDASSADVVVISDTGMWDIATPAITTRLRGSTYVELGLRVAARDLHSGLFGGSAQNAANVMARVLGDLHNPEGRVQVPGFYDGVTPLAPELLASWERLDFDESAFLGRMGLRTPAGERGDPRWSGSGAGRPPTSPACGAAIPVPAPRPSFPPRRTPKCRSVSCPGRIPRPCSKGSADLCRRGCRRRVRRPMT